MKCGCRKNGNPCGPGCHCQGCTNLPAANQEQHIHADSVDDDTESEDEQNSNEDDSEQSEPEDQMEAEIVTEYFNDLLVDLPP